MEQPMTKTARTVESRSALEPPPVRIKRTLHASRELVFKAWSSAEHVKRWFAPAGFTVPQANVEMRVGGPFEVLMRGPDGIEHWVRGKFTEVSKFDRLAIDITVEDARGRRLFRAFTEAKFTVAPVGIEIDVAQTYTVLDPDSAWMVDGAPQGWAQTLDNLSTEVARMLKPDGTPRSVVHATFTLERAYDAPVERLYQALSDETAKTKWFSGVEGQWRLIERSMDFRVGGRERVQGKWEGGVTSTFDAIYQDIIPDERIVYTYEMHLDERKISVSLATFQLKSNGSGGSILKLTEQGAFLDGYDDAGSRERGTNFLLDRLGASLKA
jgi:uncharacterized protein YndB with AHSA1/START domain